MVNSIEDNYYFNNEEPPPPPQLVRQDTVASRNDAEDQVGVVVLNANQRIVGTPSLMSPTRVEEVRNSVLGNARAPGQIIRTFQSLSEMQVFLASRRERVLLRVRGVLEDFSRLLTPEEIDRFTFQNTEILRFDSEFSLNEYLENVSRSSE
jgi:hypothetical protein